LAGPDLLVEVEADAVIGTGADAVIGTGGRRAAARSG
jgi:hypothetical protein